MTTTRNPSRPKRRGNVYVTLRDPAGREKSVSMTLRYASRTQVIRALDRLDREVASASVEQSAA